MPTGVYPRKAKTAPQTSTTKTPTTPKATRRRKTTTTEVPTVLPNDPNQTSEEWQELRYNEVLGHPTWMISSAGLAKRHLQMAQARRIRRRVITRSKWEVIE